MYELTLKNGAGRAETLDVTGTHPFYDQSAGWTEVQDLRGGEALRGDHGTLTVASVVRDPGTVRVYNLDVEGDHVYYVGDLDALVHNDCSSDAAELRDNLGYAGISGPGEAAHIVPSNRQGAIFDTMREILEEVGIDVNDAENGFIATNRGHNGTHKNSFYSVLFKALSNARGDQEGVEDVLESVRQVVGNGGQWK